MKTFKLFILLLVITFLNESAYCQEISGTQAIIKKGVLDVAMHEKDQPPFFMVDKGGTLIGVDVEIAKKIGESLGVEVRFNRDSKTFDEVIEKVKNKEADLGISKLSFTLLRARSVLYTDPYMVLRKALLINRLVFAKIKATRSADTLHQLMNEKSSVIGVIDKSSYVTFAHDYFPDTTIVPMATWENDILKSLEEGKILAAFRDESEVMKYFFLKPEANFTIMPVILKNNNDPIHMVVAPDNFHFKDWLDGFLITLHQELTVSSILSKYESYFEYKNENKPVNK